MSKAIKGSKLMTEIGLGHYLTLGAIIFSIGVIGIFLNISTTILFEINEDHKFNMVKFVSIVVGFGIAGAFSFI